MRASLKEVAENTVLASFPAVVLFVMIPLAIYLPNRVEFEHGPYLFLLFFTFALAWLAFFAAWFWLAPRRGARWAPRWVFFGIFLGLSDLLAPVTLGSLTGGEVKIEEPLSLTMVELALALGLILAAWKVPVRVVRSITPVLVLVLLLSEGVLAATSLWGEIEKPGRPAKIEKKVAVNEKLGNIYHIVLDGNPNHNFLQNRDRFKALGSLQGFVFFPQARSNFLGTKMSFASFLTGRFFPGGSLKTWMNGWKSGGVFRAATDAGYQITSYQTYPNIGPQGAGRVYLGGDGAPRPRWVGESVSFAKLWAVRVAPNFLQGEAFFFMEKYVSAMVDGYPDFWARRVGHSAELMRRMIREERDRPARGQYVFGHFLLPHEPFVLDSQCQYRFVTDHQSQTRCAFRLILELVNELKALGRFEGTSIVIHSDHGLWASGPEESGSFISEPDAEKLGINGDRYRWRNGRVLDRRSRALFLVKPAGSGQAPLRVSDRRVQLIDIAPTIAGLAGLQIGSTEGVSVLAREFPAERPLHLFFGMEQRKDGKMIRLFETPKGELDHVSFSKSRGWQKLPSIPTLAQ